MRFKNILVMFQLIATRALKRVCGMTSDRAWKVMHCKKQSVHTTPIGASYDTAEC